MREEVVGKDEHLSAANKSRICQTSANSEWMEAIQAEINVGQDEILKQFFKAKESEPFISERKTKKVSLGDSSMGKNSM